MDELNPASQLLFKGSLRLRTGCSPLSRKRTGCQPRGFRSTQVSRFSVSTTPLIPDFGREDLSSMGILFLLQLCLSQNYIQILIFDITYPATSGDKSVLKSCHRGILVFPAEHELTTNCSEPVIIANAVNRDQLAPWSLLLLLSSCIPSTTAATYPVSRLPPEPHSNSP